MSFFKFHEDDLFINTIEAYPEYRFYVHSGTIFINDTPNISGKNINNHIGVPKGFVSLYEYNIDRNSNYIYPFLEKDGHKNTFKNTKASTYNTQYLFGEVLTSSYNMSASISTVYYTSTIRPKISALINVFNHYSYLSPHYQYISSFGRKDTQNINLVSIPSIFYGNKIKKGTVSWRAE